MTKQKTIFVTDFDGTITKEDFFMMAAERLLDDAALAPWREYKAGRLSHIDALNGVFAQIHLSQKDMDAFIASIKVDEYFYKVLPLCRQLGIPVYICSAGSEYYVNKRIEDTVKEYGIKVFSNGGSYSPETGLTLIAPPKDSPLYSPDTGISKENLIQQLKDEGYFIIFAGDGRPDIKPARKSDIVFAKSTLLELCKEEGIKTLKFDSFKDILDYLEAGYGNNA